MISQTCDRFCRGGTGPHVYASGSKRRRCCWRASNAARRPPAWLGPGTHAAPVAPRRATQDECPGAMHAGVRATASAVCVGCEQAGAQLQSSWGVGHAAPVDQRPWAHSGTRRSHSPPARRIRIIAVAQRPVWSLRALWRALQAATRVRKPRRACRELPPLALEQPCKACLTLDHKQFPGYTTHVQAPLPYP